MRSYDILRTKIKGRLLTKAGLNGIGTSFIYLFCKYLYIIFTMIDNQDSHPHSRSHVRKIHPLEFQYIIITLRKYKTTNTKGQYLLQDFHIIQCFHTHDDLFRQFLFLFIYNLHLLRNLGRQLCDVQPPYTPASESPHVFFFLSLLLNQQLSGQ